MPTQEIIMDFDDDENPVITVKGVAGKACKTLTADLESKLGTVIDDKLTADYNKTEAKHGNQARQS